MCLITQQHRCNYSSPFKSITYADLNGHFAVYICQTKLLFHVKIAQLHMQYLSNGSHPSLSNTAIRSFSVKKKTLLLSLHCLYNAEHAQKHAHCSSFFYLGTKIRTKKFRDVTNSHESLATPLWQHDIQVAISTRPLFCPSQKHTLLQQENKTKKQYFFIF